MSQYILRRLLIAIPSLLGISLALFTVLALAPGDPFGELAANPNVPPEVAAELRRKAIMVDDFPKDFGRSELYQTTQAVTFEALARRDGAPARRTS